MIYYETIMAQTNIYNLPGFIFKAILKLLFTFGNFSIIIFDQLF